MCAIAPGGIPGIAIGPRGDIAAAEPTTIDEAIVATTTTTASTTRNPGAPEFGILARWAHAATRDTSAASATTAALIALKNRIRLILKLIGKPQS
jgi:hypothetical protein